MIARTVSSSGARCSCIGVLYDRLHSRQIADYGGVVHHAQVRSLHALHDGQPGLLRPPPASSASSWWCSAGAGTTSGSASVAATTLIRRCVFAVDVLRVVFGKVAQPRRRAEDINGREFALLTVLAACVLAMGLYPKPLHRSDARSVNELCGMLPSKLPERGPASARDTLRTGQKMNFVVAIQPERPRSAAGAPGGHAGEHLRAQRARNLAYLLTRRPWIAAAFITIFR